MRRLRLKKDAAYTVTIRPNGWTMVYHNGKMVAHAANFEAARQYIYKRLHGENGYISEEDFEEVG